MADYVHGGKSFDATKTRVCDGLSDGTFLSKLSPDRISLPASNWDDDAEIVSVQKCDADTAIAVCSGAPCYDDDKGSTKGHLTQTCLCPVYPFSAHESFKLTAPDVGHMHGCRARTPRRRRVRAAGDVERDRGRSPAEVERRGRRLDVDGAAPHRGQLLPRLRTIGIFPRVPRCHVCGATAHRRRRLRYAWLCRRRCTA